MFAPSKTARGPLQSFSVSRADIVRRARSMSTSSAIAWCKPPTALLSRRR